MKMINFENIKYIGFDADDTLWINELYFHNTENELKKILKRYVEEDSVSRELLKTETENVKLYGFGAKGFIISQIETAIRITESRITAEDIKKIISFGKKLFESSVDLFDGTEDVLKALKSRYKLIVATKGDLFDQERKLKASGLEQYFHHIEIMRNKKTENYTKLLNHLEIKPSEFLMIGNSMNSDILPVLEIGGSAVQIPYIFTWAYENKTDNNIDMSRYKKIDKITELLKIIPEM
jgi:putative hydrolase of the HAD superfamily